MKGMIFVELMEMVEEKFSARTLETVIEAADLPTGGAYTTVGTYDHKQLLRLVSCLSEKVDVPIPALVRTFGEHLFQSLLRDYPQKFHGVKDAFEFVAMIDGNVHVEVRKLYPDAELPSFACERTGTNDLTFIYRSNRPFADLAHGMLNACIAHFGESITVERHDEGLIPGTQATFVLHRNTGAGL